MDPPATVRSPGRVEVRATALRRLPNSADTISRDGAKRPHRAATLDLRPPPAREGRQGSKGDKGRRPGWNRTLFGTRNQTYAGAAGGSGGHGAHGEHGDIGQAGPTGTIYLSGTPQRLGVRFAGTMNYFCLNDKGHLYIDCRGGTGGRGGDGGNGGKGSEGMQGKDAESKTQRAGDGGRGGDGGNGGNGGRGGTGGAGGDVTIVSDDPRLLFLVEVDVRGGEGGAAGNKGKAGGAGNGGPPGRPFRRVGFVRKRYRGLSGSRGRSGQCGSDGDKGQPGPTGSLVFGIRSPEGHMRQAPNRFGVALTSYTVVDSSNEKVFEPGTVGIVTDITVTNNGWLPLPEGAVLTIDSTDGISNEGSRAVVPAIGVNESATLATHLSFKVKPQACAAGQALHSQVAIVPRIHILAREVVDAAPPAFVTSQYPAALQPVICPSCVSPGDHDIRVEVAVRNNCEVPMGTVRTVAVTFAADPTLQLVPMPDPDVDYDQVRPGVWSASVSNVPVGGKAWVRFNGTVPQDNELLMKKLGWNVSLSVSGSVPGTHVQTEHGYVRVSPVFRPGQAQDVVLATCGSTTPTALSMWTSLFSSLNLKLSVWDVERHNGVGPATLEENGRHYDIDMFAADCDLVVVPHGMGQGRMLSLATMQPRQLKQLCGARESGLLLVGWGAEDVEHALFDNGDSTCTTREQWRSFNPFVWVFACISPICSYFSHKMARKVLRRHEKEDMRYRSMAALLTHVCTGYLPPHTDYGVLQVIKAGVPRSSSVVCTEWFDIRTANTVPSTSSPLRDALASGYACALVSSLDALPVRALLHIVRTEPAVLRATFNYEQGSVVKSVSGYSVLLTVLSAKIDRHAMLAAGTPGDVTTAAIAALREVDHAHHAALVPCTAFVIAALQTSLSYIRAQMWGRGRVRVPRYVNASIASVLQLLARDQQEAAMAAAKALLEAQPPCHAALLSVPALKHIVSHKEDDKAYPAFEGAKGGHLVHSSPSMLSDDLPPPHRRRGSTLPLLCVTVLAVAMVTRALLRRR